MLLHVNKKQLRPALHLLLLLSLLVGCEKHRIKKKYTGDFTYTIHTHSWDMNQNIHDTTTTYEGTIVVERQRPENAERKDAYLRINYGPASYIVTKVNSDGSFESQTVSTTHFEGGFTSNDELDFIYSTGGLGSGNTYTVHGVRR